MTDPTANKTGCFSLIAGLVVIGLGFALFIRHQDHEAARIRELRDETRRQEVISQIEAGSTQVVIYDVELLARLANNQKCVETVNNITFATVTVSEKDAAAASRFHNLRKLSFYDCKGADDVLKACRELPIEYLFFESTRVSDNSLLSLGKLKSLNKVHFEQLVNPQQAEILKQLPSTIVIEKPDQVEGK
jgi:hypothetical protein